MAANLSRFLSTHILLIIVVLNFAANTKQDAALPDQTYECPYPCVPQPITATSNCLPPPGPPPPPPSPPMPTAFPPPPPPGSDYYTPPSGYFSPPSGYFPSYSPPWYFDIAPPPPDPILPYFPFYYKQPPPPPDFSSATRLVRSMVWISSLISLLLLSWDIVSYMRECG
ncbi:hypothetical protein RHGRI_028884 [Rhododendron griersonianum]|uniref:Uncharacterized protein n=1 Tax=Rhododendron griersonianum TaxID=479676 RepID=A0AAV6IJR0_9ERIC|nr:hypothetical protein RHGRI_028884 [Rhododendron griersonianum]